jgi:ribosome-associated protein
MLKVNEAIAIPLHEFHWEFARSSGPGGQNVNKVNSKAVLRWKPARSEALPEAVRVRLLRKLKSRLTTQGELLVTSQHTRDRGRNVDDCLEKVRRLVLAAAEPPKPRRPSRPTLASKIRRAEQKSQRSATKRLRQKPDLE